jgi:hypothetical protein
LTHKSAIGGYGEKNKVIVGWKRNWWIEWEYLLVSCPAEHAAMRESVKHNGCRRITTLYLSNYTRVKVDEHGSYIRSSVPLTSVGARADRGRSTVATPWSLAANSYALMH